MTTQLPIGIRLNNPGNLEWGSPWQGLVPRKESMYANTGTQQQRRFAQFKNPVYGIRAIARTLITYQDKRTAKDGSRIDTVREIIERWAPSHENNVDAYTTAVRRAMFGNPNAPIAPLNVHEYATLRPLVEAIIRHENGRGPLGNANTWYSDDVIDEGLRLAGVVKPAPVVAKVPVTRETVAATGVGGVGAVQIAEAAPAILDAIERSDAHLSSGSVIRVIVGLVSIGLAAYIAWSQVKKHQAGTLA